tara:strand:- start:480 stop:1715 length:1236 start_codon:yes stop_codon:yes gene_type:complete
MAQYYDPREAATTFSLYANIAQTQRQKEEEEAKETSENIALTKEVGGIPLKLLETRRAEHLQEARTLLSQRDPRTSTGFKFKPAEYVAPERKRYNPRRLKDWFNARYGRPGEERVTREAIVKPSDPTKSEIFESGVPVSMSTPEGNRAYMERYQDKAFYRDFTPETGRVQASQPKFKTPPVDPVDPARGTIAYDELTAKTSQEASDIWKGVAETRGREIGIREGMRGQSAPGYKPGRPLMQHKLKAKPVIPDGVISEQIGKPLIPKTQYGSFDELVRARNAARGTKGLGVIQEQVNQYMPKGTSYGEASKAFDATKAATKTATAVDTGGEVIGAAGETAGGFTPGVGEAMAAGELAGIWSESGGRGEDKIKATAGTAFDYGTSAMIASGNPYLAIPGAIGKVGKAAWEYLA